MADYNSAFTGAQIDSAVLAVRTNGDTWSGKASKALSFSAQSVAASAWAADTTYDGYGYRASIALTGVTAAMYAEVVFSPADATGGNFAPVCDTAAGAVYIYAKTAPVASITIPRIIAMEVSA